MSVFDPDAGKGPIRQPAPIKRGIAKPVVKRPSTSINRNAGGSPAKKKTSTVRRSTGGSGSSGNSGSSGGSSKAPVAAPKPTVPGLNAYLGTDSAYQNAVSGGKRSLNDFLSEMNRRRGEAGTQFNQTTASMEHDRVQQLEDLRNEFASRGLIQSGLYGEQQGNFQQKFTEQRTALDQQQAALLADLLGQETNYKREQELTLEQAKQEALLRRSQKYNIGA